MSCCLARSGTLMREPIPARSSRSGSSCPARICASPCCRRSASPVRSTFAGPSGASRTNGTSERRLRSWRSSSGSACTTAARRTPPSSIRCSVLQSANVGTSSLSTSSSLVCSCRISPRTALTFDNVCHCAAAFRSRRWTRSSQTSTPSRTATSAIDSPGIAPLFYVASAVDTQCFAGDEVAVDEREHGFGNLLLATPSPERRHVCNLLMVLGCGRRRRQNRTRRDRVDENIVGRQLERERFRQCHHARFRDVVRKETFIARPSAAREPVAERNDAAASLLPHVRHGRDRAEKRRAQVDVDRLLPCGEIKLVERCGLIHGRHGDKDVKATKRLGGLRHRLRALTWVTEVGLQRDSPTTECRDFGNN